MRQPVRLLAVPLAFALIATACGKDRSEDAATTSAVVTTVPSSVATTAIETTDSAAPDATGGTAATTAPTDTTPVTEAAPDVPTFGDAAWPCGPGDGANKDDGSVPGVSADSVTIADGDDAGYAGSPGLNHEMTDAMNAMVAKCNELGGINGRKIVANYYDAKLFEVGPAIQGACDAGTFFLVGEGWAFDSNQEEIRLGCSLPAVPSFATSAAFTHGKDTFPPLPNPADEATTEQYVQWAKLFPDAVGSAAALVGAFTATQDSRDRAVAAATQSGWNWVSTTIEYNPTGEADWTPFIKQIQDAGAKIVFWSGACLPNLQLFMQSAEANGLDIPVVTDANHYAASCAEANTDGALDNLYIRVNSVPFEEASSTPAVKDYLDLITASGGDTALLGTNAASAFLLWATAASACGDTLTRECAIENLKNTHDWTGHGLHAATDPGANHPPKCGAIFKLTGTAYERVTPTEPGTYDCDAPIVSVGQTPAVVAAKLDADRISQEFAGG